MKVQTAAQVESQMTAQFNMNDAPASRQHSFLSAATFASAARQCTVTMLQSLHAGGCPVDETAIIAAAEGGNLPVFQWMVENNFPYEYDVELIMQKHPNPEILEWLHSEDRAFRSTYQ